MEITAFVVFLYVVAILVIPTLLACFYYIQKKRYEKTDYYKQTNNSFKDILYNKGIKGEYLIWKYLIDLPGYKKYLFNCYFPKDNGETTEVDVILLHESGIYVFESKNYSGWIFGSEEQRYWTQTLSNGKSRAHKERFFNPIIQNNVHLKWMGKYLDMETEQFYSYIVFSDRCVLKKITLTSKRHHVINRYNILSAVRENAKSVGTKLTNEEIEAIYAKLQPLTQVDENVKQEHIEEIQKKQKHKSCTLTEVDTQKTEETVNVVEAEEQTEGEMCPRCGGKLVLRKAGKGEKAGKEFWGCSNYPKCRYIKNVDDNGEVEQVRAEETTEVLTENIHKKERSVNVIETEEQTEGEICPRCGGKLVLRKAGKGEKAGKEFWGCSNYPKCRYIKNVDDNGEEGKVQAEETADACAEDIHKKEEPVNVVGTEEQAEGEICPRCGGKLVLRKAGKGENAGKEFWGCSNYPKCRYIKNVETLNEGEKTDLQ